LVLDFMEQFRPLVDELVLNFFVKEKLTKSILMQISDGSIRFQPQFLRHFISVCRLEQGIIDQEAAELKARIQSLTDE